MESTLDLIRDVVRYVYDYGPSLFNPLHDQTHLAGPSNVYKECICRIQNGSLLLFSGLGLVGITGKRNVQLLG